MAKSEFRSKIDSGFFLTETEVVRLKDALNEQIKKLSNGIDAELTYNTKYVNGITAQPSTLDDILSDENDGTKALVRLAISASNKNNADDVIRVVFNDNGDSKNDGEPSIWYSIESEDRDWTFVTLSLVEERLNKTKVNKITNYITGINFRSLPLIAASGFMLVFYYFLANATTNRLDQIRRARALSKSAIEYNYRVDLIQANEMQGLSGFPKLILVLVCVTVVAFVIFKPLRKWLPSHTFFWGDQVRRYNKKCPF